MLFRQEIGQLYFTFFILPSWYPECVVILGNRVWYEWKSQMMPAGFGKSPKLNPHVSLPVCKANILWLWNLHKCNGNVLPNSDSSVIVYSDYGRNPLCNCWYGVSCSSQNLFNPTQSCLMNKTRILPIPDNFSIPQFHCPAWTTTILVLYKYWQWPANWTDNNFSVTPYLAMSSQNLCDYTQKSKLWTRHLFLLDSTYKQINYLNWGLKINRSNKLEKLITLMLIIYLIEHILLTLLVQCKKGTCFHPSYEFWWKYMQFAFLPLEAIAIPILCIVVYKSEKVL